jgi:hypothetical protein
MSKTEIFLQKGLDSQITDLPVGRKPCGVLRRNHHMKVMGVQI